MSARDDDRSPRPTTGAADPASAAGREGNSAERRDESVRRSQSQIERETDLLVQLAAGQVFMDMNLDDPRQHAFLDWLARDLRERQTPAEKVERGLQAAAFARRMVARMRARGTIRVDTITGKPVVRPALEQGGVLQVVRAAARHRCAPLSNLAVAAGIGRELWDEPCEQWIDLPHDVPDGSYVGLTVSGDSMQPLLHEGDVMLVQMGSEVFEDTMIVARHPDDGYVVKRVGNVADNAIELTSLNPAFAPLQIPRDASLIVGTVVMTWCSHRQAA